MVRRKHPLTRRFSLEIYVIETERRRVQARSTCTIFEQLEPWAERQIYPPGQAEPITQYFSTTSGELEYFAQYCNSLKSSGCPSLYSPFSSMYHNIRLLTAIGQKKASPRSMVFTGDARNRDRKKSSGQTIG